MIELLAISFGRWIRIEFDSVEEALGAADLAIDCYPGPYAPDTVFENGEPLFEDWIYQKPCTPERREELIKLYNQATQEERD